jgi:hypothetical protein
VTDFHDTLHDHHDTRGKYTFRVSLFPANSNTNMVTDNTDVEAALVPLNAKF